MTNLENELSKLIKEHGIEAVMNNIKSNHSDKVFIPNWYCENHLKYFGFELDDEYFDMCAFNEFMSDRGIEDHTNYMIEDDYPSLWEDYIENNS